MLEVKQNGQTSVVYASDYLNKIAGEQIERECKRQIDGGCEKLIVSFKDTEIVNSIGVSILLGVIDAASNAGTDVEFSDVNNETGELFKLLGLTKHVTFSVCE